MLDILIFLFRHFQESGEFPNAEYLSLKLNATGFDEEEIQEALVWIFDVQRSNGGVYPHELSPTGIRHYSDYERRFLSLESLHFIEYLHASHAITSLEREMILDRVLLLGRESLSLPLLKLIVLLVLHPRLDSLDPLLVDDLLTPVSHSHSLVH